uniref:Uncharacterized protein n=1 Tax=Strongyloides papillosus TaxID=174720 RepID=A0A0N5BGV7_STREA
MADDVKAQEKGDEELLDCLFGNKGEITDSDESSDDEFKAPLPVVMGTNKPFSIGHKRNAQEDKLSALKNFVKIKKKK